MPEITQDAIDAMARRRLRVIGLGPPEQIAEIDRIYVDWGPEPIYQFAYEGQVLADCFARQRVKELDGN